jgi:pyruvate formate lyase activating enzyme
MKVAGLVRTSTLDFPGHLAAVVFTAGCDLDCFFCHNRTLLGRDAPDLPLTEVIAFLEKRKGLLDGVVISGGEPTLQPDLASFMFLLQGMGYAVKLDTHGGYPRVIESLLKTSPRSPVDYVAMDYKAPWLRYPDICDCGSETVEGVQESLLVLARLAGPAGVAWEVRTTVVPQLSEDDLVNMAASIPPVPLYALQLYRRPAVIRPGDHFRVAAAAMTPARMEAAAVRMRGYQPNVVVRA